MAIISILKRHTLEKLMRALKIFFIFPIILCSCNSQITSSNANKINEKIISLEKEIISLHQTINTLKNNELMALKNDIYTLRIENAVKQLAIFTPSNTGFQLINTDSGILLVSLKNIEEYADGYKITFSIGNPSTATYSNASITLTYGPKDKKYNSIDLAHAAKYETDINQDLIPGYWNDVQIVLSNAKKEQLNYIWFTITPKTIELNTKTIKNNK
jgi:hypothetical protein